jgi:hypothetical protein
MESKPFKSYLIKLHKDDAELVRFKKDPDACIATAGLTKAQGHALKSKDQAHIQAALDAEAGATVPMGHIELTLKALIDRLK